VAEAADRLLARFAGPGSSDRGARGRLWRSPGACPDHFKSAQPCSQYLFIHVVFLTHGRRIIHPFDPGAGTASHFVKIAWGDRPPGFRGTRESWLLGQATLRAGWSVKVK